MKTVYLEQNILHYLVHGFPSSMDATAEEDALRECLSAVPDLRFALTDWHVVEAARECAHAADPLALGNRYADLFERLQAIYLEGHRTLERTEIADFVYPQLGLRTEPKSGWMFATEFSQVASSTVPEMLVGFTPRIFLRHLIKTETSRAEFFRAAGLARDAQQTCIDAYNAGLQSDKQLQLQLHRAWLLSLIPERDLDKRWIELDRRERLATALSSRLDEVFAHCPAVFVESSIADMRAKAGGRKAKPQDGFDLMHVIPALAYCDAFVSNDGPLRAQAKKISEQTGRRIVIAASLSECKTRLI